MTRVFIADISQLNSDISLYKDCVSKYRYEKAISYKNPKNKLTGIGAELLLSQYLGRVPEYKIDEFGKPCGEKVEFNFSHSGNIAVCAVSDNPVGVDVEKIRDIDINIAKKKFSTKEYDFITNSTDPTNSFFEIWVKKESYVKALGKGLRIPLNEIDTDAITEWKFYMYNIDGYKLCVCTKEEVEFIEKNLN